MSRSHYYDDHSVDNYFTCDDHFVDNHGVDNNQIFVNIAVGDDPIVDDDIVDNSEVFGENVVDDDQILMITLLIIVKFLGIMLLMMTYFLIAKSLVLIDLGHNDIDDDDRHIDNNFVDDEYSSFRLL